MVRKATGASYPAVSDKIVAESLIPLPPLEEQRRIAGILDAADALRRRRREALALLDTLPGAIFAEMFGEGKGLENAPAKDLIEVRSSLADPTLPENAELPHVGPEHIHQGGGRIEWERVQSCQEDGVTSGKYHFCANDVIYSKIRPYLNKVAIADRTGMCSADMYALRPSSKRMTVRYLHFILGSAEFLAYGNRVSGRANIPKMNRKQLLEFDVPLPSADQQKEFEKSLDAIDVERKNLVGQFSEIETLFASLQSRAFAGAL
jgi:type I restriction enzyme S subunit